MKNKKMTVCTKRRQTITKNGDGNPHLYVRLIRIALRISATAAELLFPVARSALIRGPSSAPVPFLRPASDKRCCGQTTDDEMRLYQYKTDYSIFSPSCQGGKGKKSKKTAQNKEKSPSKTHFESLTGKLVYSQDLLLSKSQE